MGQLYLLPIFSPKIQASPFSEPVNRLSVWEKGEKIARRAGEGKQRTCSQATLFSICPFSCHCQCYMYYWLFTNYKNLPGKSDGEVNATCLFGSFQQKISGTNGKSEKVILLFPNGSLCAISSKPFLFQALVSFFHEMELICTNGKRDPRTKFTSFEFCLPFAQTVNRPVCPYKWLNKYYI